MKTNLSTTSASEWNEREREWEKENQIMLSDSHNVYHMDIIII